MDNLKSPDLPDVLNAIDVSTFALQEVDVTPETACQVTFYIILLIPHSQYNSITMHACFKLS